MSDDATLARVGAHRFFTAIGGSGFSADQLAAIARCARGETFAAGAALAREGGPADRFYALESGRVTVEIHVPHRGPVVIATLGAGDMLGWSWLFPPRCWHFDAHATGPTEAIVFDAEALRAVMDADPVLGLELTRRVAGVVTRRLEATRLQLVDLYGHPGDV